MKIAPRRLILIIGILMGIAAAALFVGVMFSPAPFTKDNYLLLKAGMTKDEVHAVVGNPDDSQGTTERYIGDEGSAILFYDLNRDTLVWRQWDEFSRRPSLLECYSYNIQRLIGRCLRFG